VPFQLFFWFQNYFVNSQSKILNITDPNLLISKYPWFIPVVAVVNLVFVVVSFWINAGGILAVSKVVAGEKPSVKKIYADAWKKLWPFSLLLVVLGIAIGLGFLLLIIPGVLFLVWFVFAEFELMLKGSGVKAAMMNSKTLVKGRFWKILGRIVVFGLFQLLLQIFFSIAPFGVGSIISSVFGALFFLPNLLLYKELSV
jgi:hypothetical protein